MTVVAAKCQVANTADGFTECLQTPNRQQGGIGKIVAFSLPFRSLTLPILALDWWPKRLAIPFTQLEMDALRNPKQVDTFEPHELAVLWQYATPLQRTYLALALNFGFGQMKIRTC
jgi:hypothetical protein